MYVSMNLCVCGGVFFFFCLYVCMQILYIFISCSPLNLNHMIIVCHSIHPSISPLSRHWHTHAYALYLTRNINTPSCTYIIVKYLNISSNHLVLFSHISFSSHFINTQNHTYFSTSRLMHQAPAWAIVLMFFPPSPPSLWGAVLNGDTCLFREICALARAQNRACGIQRQKVHLYIYIYIYIYCCYHHMIEVIF